MMPQFCFLLFLAVAAILFSRAGRFEQFGRGLPKEHSLKCLKKSAQQCQRRSFLKQILQCMHVIFYGKSAPLMTFEGLMNRGTNG